MSDNDADFVIVTPPRSLTPSSLPDLESLSESEDNNPVDTLPPGSPPPPSWAYKLWAYQQQMMTRIQKLQKVVT